MQIQNLTLDINGKVWATMFGLYMPTRQMDLISTGDVSRFVAECFLHPDKWAGRFTSLSADKMSFDEMKERFKSKTGEYCLPALPRLVVRGMGLGLAELVTMFKWFQSNGYDVDVQKSREILPDMLTFGDWLESKSAWNGGKAA